MNTIADQLQLQDRDPDPEVLAELLSWQPAAGVVSLYAVVDPGDRSDRWRRELRNGLEEAVKSVADGDREVRLAVEATARRLEDSVLAVPGEIERRGLIGFVEATREDGRERWYATQIPPRRTEVLYGPQAKVAPLLAILDEGAPLGVAVVSSERVRLLHAFPGGAQQLHAWEIELADLDWRERKAQRPTGRGGGTMVSAAGRDQHDQRLESNRHRFVQQAGGLARREAGEHRWRQLLVYGDERYTKPFAEGFGDACELRHVDSVDLISQPTHEIADRVDALRPELNRGRERELVERLNEAAYAEARGAFGPQETMQALEEGRVEHLLYDTGREHGEIERMVELAVSTGAEVTPLEGESAAGLSERDGVAALLRY